MEIDRVSVVSKVKRAQRVGRVGGGSSRLEMGPWIEELRAMADIRMEKMTSERARPTSEALVHAMIEDGV